MSKSVASNSFGSDWGERVVVEIDQLIVERYEEKPGVWYQRPLSAKKAKQIADHLDEHLYGLPVVTETSPKKLAVLDGATRFSALHLLGMTQSPALLLPPMTVRKRADVFHALNTLARSLRSIDKFRSAHAKGDYSVTKIVHIMGDFKIVATEGSTGVNAIAAVGATQKIYNLGGEELFHRTLYVITQSWPDNPQRLTGEMLLGVATFLHRDNGKTTDDNLVARLAATKVSDIIGQASDLRSKTGGKGLGGGSPVYIAKGIAIRIYGAKAQDEWPYS